MSYVEDNNLYECDTKSLNKDSVFVREKIVSWYDVSYKRDLVVLGRYKENKICGKYEKTSRAFISCK